eukprot:scaffold181874_cov40-Tisochrysis_lutea.AAC.3
MRSHANNRRGSVYPICVRVSLHARHPSHRPTRRAHHTRAGAQGGVVQRAQSSQRQAAQYEPLVVARPPCIPARPSSCVSSGSRGHYRCKRVAQQRAPGRT